MNASAIFAPGAILALAIGHAPCARASACGKFLKEIANARDEDGPAAAAKALVRIAHENADENPTRKRIMQAPLISGLPRDFPERERRLREISGK